MQVIDPAAMRVRVLVNQADVRFLGEGQTARVRLDAYPELVFPGTLERIAAIAKVSDLSEGVRTFAALFALKGQEPRLLPDLSAAVDVELERKDDVLVAPRDAVVREGDKGEKSFVRVARSRGFDRHPAASGPSSDHEVVILSGVDAGAVLLRDSAASVEQ